MAARQRGAVLGGRAGALNKHYRSNPGAGVFVMPEDLNGKDDITQWWQGLFPMVNLGFRTMLPAPGS